MTPRWLDRVFKQDWTPEEADEWRWQDLAAAILSPFAFVAAMVGTIYLFLLDVRGLWWSAAAVGASMLLWGLQNAKLKAQSVAFRRHERRYRAKLEQRQRWWKEE